MIKKLILLFLGMAFFHSSTAFANNDFYVELICPSTAYVGKALNVNVEADNEYDSTSIALKRYTSEIVGNYNNILSGTHVYGPYAKALSTGITLSPMSSVTFSIPVVSAVPADLKGKMAMVVVEFIDNYGRSIEGGSCLVNVK